MENRAFVAIGEEATRGTKEATTVGFVPVQEFKLVKPDFMAKKRGEFRGEDSLLGPTTEIRMGQKWEGLELAIPFFTEAGTTKGIIGTLLKHFFGKTSSGQNGATGQYYHMLYGVSDMFAAANLGTKGLSVNMNFMEAAVLKNYPYIGGRVQKIGFKQETGQPLIFSAGLLGQKLDAITAGLSSPVFPAENLRCDYNNLTIYTGVVTRTGTPPNYTNLASAATVIKPDSISLDLERGMTDKIILDGNDFPNKTNNGQITGKLSMALDWEDPSSGFSSVDDFTAWLAATSAMNVLLKWDTGTLAGTGDNHSFFIDLPICNRLGGMPVISLEKDPMITLEYDLHMDFTTTLYLVGMLLKNTATAI
jgi:hypothetical protein